MVMCFVPDCKHYSERDRCSFFRFPPDEKEKNTWIRNIRRADKLPTKFSLVCGCHFEDNLKANGPTIFERNKDKILMLETPEKKRNKRACTSSTRNETQSNIQMMDTGDNQELGADVSNKVPKTSQGVVLLSCESYYMLKKEIEQLKAKINKLEKPPFTYNSIKEKGHLLTYYTGLPKHEVFDLIFKICSKGSISYYAGWKVETLTQEDQLLLTLMKLKLNLGLIDLSVRFGISIATVSNTVLTWIHLLHEIIFQKLMAKIPSQAKNKVCFPLCINSSQNCRIVLDCTEINVEIPKKIDQQKLFYSNHKHRNTMKVLLGIAPNGVIAYVSELFPGSKSDREIFENCDVSNIFQPGDMILADKDFLMSDLLPPEVHVNYHPSLSSPQFTPGEITTNIARARIHVERTIRRVQVFKITKLIPKSFFLFSTKVFQVCAALTNFQSPLTQELQNLYDCE